VALGKLRSKFRAHGWGYISCLTLSPDGKTLASGSYDGTVKLWSMEKLLEASK